MYLALKRLEKNGLAVSYWDDSDTGGGGRRKYYRLTNEGHVRLQDKRTEWKYVKDTMDKFLGGAEV